MSLGTATIDGGLLEFSANGSGAGGNVSLQGTLTTANQTVTFNSQVKLIADETIITTFANGTGGGDISFINPGTFSVESASHSNLTLQAGTGNISFTSAAGLAGSELGTFTVLSAFDVTLQTVNATGENITNTASNNTLLINGLQTLQAGGFLQIGAATVDLKGDIVTSNGTITLTSPVVLFGATRTLDTTNGGLANGSNINIGTLANGTPVANASVTTPGSTNLTLTAGAGNVRIFAPITTLGIFTSTGEDFTNGDAGHQGEVISASGISIMHTGNVTIWSDLNSPNFNVITQGKNVTLEQGANITGNQVQQNSTISVIVDGIILAPNGYTSINNSNYTITPTGSITTNGTDATITYLLGNVTINGFIDTRVHSGPGTLDGTLTINGINITTTSTGTIDAGLIRLNATGDINIGGRITGTSNFNSSSTGFGNGTGFISNGNNFINTAPITAPGIDLNHANGTVQIQGPLVANNSRDIVIFGNGIATSGNGTMNAGGNIALTSGADVSIASSASATFFFSSSGGNFINTASVFGGSGIGIDHSGDVQIFAPLTSNNDITVQGNTIASNANGTIGGQNITLISSGDVNLVADVTGTGDFVSNGTTFEGGNISAATITLNHTDLITLNGNLTAASGTGPVDLNGAGVTQAAGIIDAGSLALTGTGTFTFTDANTVGILAADITGPLTFVNAIDLTVGTAGTPPINGITTNNGLLNLTLNTGNLTVSQPIDTGAAQSPSSLPPAISPSMRT